MVDETTMAQVMRRMDLFEMPEGADKLTEKQRVEATKYLVEKISTSKELREAMTKKVGQLRKEARG